MSSLAIRSRRMAILAALFLIPGALGAATSFSSYQLDFEQPDNVLGSNVPVTASSSSFSWVSFGSITIGAFPGTGSNAAVFNTSGNEDSSFFYDQGGLLLDQTGTLHRLSVDLYLTDIVGTNNSFAIFFDTSSSQAIRFYPDGTIRNSSANTQIGQFQENTILHFEAVGDTISQELTITINGVPLATSPYLSTQGLLESTRFSLGNLSGTATNNTSTVVYMDNISVAVPEPTASLFALSSVTILLIRRNRITGMTQNS